MYRRAFLRASCAAAGAAAIELVGPFTRFLGRLPTPVAMNEPQELLLRGAAVYDGTGAPPRELDVLVRGDRIDAVAPSLRSDRAEAIDLRGLALAPGFIDIHSHADLNLLVNPRGESRVRQGVTTEVVGQDGSSIGPWTEERYRQVRESYRDRYGVDIDFRDLTGFFRRLERDPAAVNLASMVGAGSVRAYVVGEDDRSATPAERERMVALVSDALAAGACGLSTGLEYPPGAFADVAELARLAAALQGTGLPYASHMRNEDDRLLAAVEEALEVGRRAGVPVQISHLKAQGERNWWKAGPVLGLLGAARAEGRDVRFDCYPYTAYSTGLANLFPLWARDGGTAAFLERLRRPELQERLRAEVREKIELLGSWDAVQITATHDPGLAWARGRRLGELAAERGEEPYDLLADLVIADRNRTGMVGFAMDDDVVGRFLADPLAIVCSDGGAFAPYGPLSEPRPHPRAYGAFPRVLGRYVRDRGDLDLADAIHKMTGAPAARLRLEGRGRVAERMFADLVAFDPATVRDLATYEGPHRYPAGIPHVLVNGRFVVRDGEHTGALPGRVVTPPKSAHLNSGLARTHRAIDPLN